MNLVNKSGIKINKGTFKGGEPKKYYKPKYELDHFQKYACLAAVNNENIVCTSHTGAGKTYVGLNYIKKVNDNGLQAHYIVPIKALANQKHKELSEIFPDVGIITGEKQINPSAKVIIETAECFRNALLRKPNDDIYSYNIDQKNIGVVVIDEVHSINLSQRGYVWEDIITQLNDNIRIVALSATVNGIEELVDWICNIKKNTSCHLIGTDKRPVPLKFSLFNNNKIHTILDGKKWNQGKWTEIIQEINNQKKISKIKNEKVNNNFLTVTYRKIRDCLKILVKKKMLPANIFVLNKNHIESLGSMLKKDFDFTTDEEKKEIINLWNRYLNEYKLSYNDKIQWKLIYPLILNGIGIHHSGIVPILKDFIEILYEKKLLKICVTTESFAMGVNFPTRTTIIVGLTKHDGSQRRFYKTDEIIQIAGRAGRRGIDDFGDCILLLDQNNDISEGQIKKILKNKPEKISSKFKFDYTFILTRLRKRIESNIDIPIEEYLLNEVMKTFFYYEEKKHIEFDKIQLSKLNEEINLNSYKELDHDINIMYEIEKLEKSKFIDGIKIHIKNCKKIDKKILKLKSKLQESDKDKNSLNKYFNIRKKIEILEIKTNNPLYSIKKQIKLLLRFLNKNKLILEDNNLSTLGYIVSEISDCNPIILAHIIENGCLDELELSEIVSLLSIFINDGGIRSNNEPSLKELLDNKIINKKFYNILNKISDFTYNFGTNENDINDNRNKNKLPYPIDSDWELHLKLFQSAKLWAEGKCWNEAIKSYKDLCIDRFKAKKRYNSENNINIPSSYEGNFIKNILRLTNIVRSVASISNIINNHTIAMKLEGFQEKLIRNEVTNDSLYQLK
jgi:superfamily II RNA helicase